MDFKYPLIRDESAEAIKEGIRNARDSNWNTLLSLRRKMVDFYENDQTDNEYLRDYGFYDKDSGRTTYFEDLPVLSTGLTEKVVNRISMVYKTPPLRTIGKEKDAYGEFIEQHVEHFNSSIEKTEQYWNLLKNVLWRPMYDADQEKYFFFIETDYIPYFIEGNPLHPVAYDIPVRLDTYSQRSSTDVIYLFVSKDFYFLHEPDSDVMKPVPGMETIDNPYKTIPLVDFSPFPVTEYWSLGGKPLVEANQMLNVMLLTMMYSFHFQSFAQPVFTNVNEKDFAKVQFGAKKVLLLPENSTAGLLQYGNSFEDMTKALIFNTNTALQQYGISSYWDDTAEIASGVALKIKNMELLERREKDVGFFRYRERQIYNILQVMTEYHKTHKLPKDADLKVDFEDPEFPKSQDEVMALWDWKVKNNYASKIDYLMEANPDLDREAAEKEYQRILEENRKLRGLGGGGATADAIREGLEE